MIYIFLIVLGIGILQFFLSKKSRIGFIIPLIALVYLLYEFFSKHNEPGFVYIDLLFPGLLFTVTTAIWIINQIRKKQVSQHIR